MIVKWLDFAEDWGLCRRLDSVGDTGMIVEWSNKVVGNTLSARTWDFSSKIWVELKLRESTGIGGKPCVYIYIYICICMYMYVYIYIYVIVDVNVSVLKTLVQIINQFINQFRTSPLGDGWNPISKWVYKP